MRRARAADLPEVVRPAAEHAAFEKAAAPPPDLARRLERLLFGTQTPRLRCFAAESNDRDGHRGLRVGPLLVEAVLAEARALGLGHVRWQTRPWNTDAIRFYDRLRARA
ncbi:GNAT family N-acetyltransferase [Streptomyces sp. IMTB 2501]|uniref:GNAT family N-acetyltransferase n=1 Tax=Streptomyces sp. IMTB 2501 TaxID=1776340 RepID=UPI0021171216|nr:GNAT family N-acetyltransferase [Streptomyces sp. IMTB 2501]